MERNGKTKTKSQTWVTRDGKKYFGTPAQVKAMIADDYGLSHPVSRVHRISATVIRFLGVTLTAED